MSLENTEYDRQEEFLRIIDDSFAREWIDCMGMSGACRFHQRPGHFRHIQVIPMEGFIINQFRKYFRN